jgi:hypothetical protein
VCGDAEQTVGPYPSRTDMVRSDVRERTGPALPWR